ncbi:MAG: flavodoxin family protein [Treponema sp.]|jgi:multimeric flavodoxin WrbA|nr:flavodoxin family protein [Treponema sp.]
MGKEILVLTGSPRKHGNSDQLADAFIRGAQSKGHRVHKFEAAFKDIHGCRGCNQCWPVETEPCVIKDDFFELAPLIETCEVAVFVSPLYFWGFTAQLKAAWDRFYAYRRKAGVQRLAIKESALLLTLGDTEDATYKHAVGTYQDIAEYIGWKDRGIVVAKGVNDKTDILGHKALARAEVLGKSIEST